MCWLCGPQLYLRLRGVVRVVGVVVLAWHGGLDAGGVEEAAQLLLLALSQAVDDAKRLLLLQAHRDKCGSACDAAGSVYVFTPARGDPGHQCVATRRACVFCNEPPGCV